MNLSAFFSHVRQDFGRLKTSQVQGFETILRASEGLPRSHRAYLLATVLKGLRPPKSLTN